MSGSQVINRLLRDTRGATAIEYGLIAALIVIAIMVSVGSVASETNEMWTAVREKMASTS